MQGKEKQKYTFFLDFRHFALLIILIFGTQASRLHLGAQASRSPQSPVKVGSVPDERKGEASPVYGTNSFFTTRPASVMIVTMYIPLG